MAENPLLSFLVLLAEFIIIFKIYHKVQNIWLHRVLAVFFIPQDVVVNLVAMSLIGLELPQEWLVTQRAHRWKRIESPNSWRQAWRKQFATGLCDILNRYDAGHC